MWQAPALGVGGHGVGVVLQFRRRDDALQGGERAAAFRGVEFATHGPDVRNGPAHGFGGQGQGEAVPGLQQDGFCLHQALADGPVGGLPHIAALGVF